MKIHLGCHSRSFPLTFSLPRLSWLDWFWLVVFIQFPLDNRKIFWCFVIVNILNKLLTSILLDYWIGFLILHGCSVRINFFFVPKVSYLYWERPPLSSSSSLSSWPPWRQTRRTGAPCRGRVRSLCHPPCLPPGWPWWSQPQLRIKIYFPIDKYWCIFFVWWKIKSIALIANNIVLINLLVWISINLVCYDKYFWSR